MKQNNIQNPQEEQKLVQEILTAIKSVRYGSVEIIIQNSKVVQIDRTDKLRFDAHKS
jgi:hypothetical protein